MEDCGFANDCVGDCVINCGDDEKPGILDAPVKLVNPELNPENNPEPVPFWL